MTAQAHDAHDPGEAFLESAREALRREPGSRGLASLDFFDLLGDLEASEARSATYAVFRAHGRELGCSPALACLMAQPYLELGLARGAIQASSVAAAILRHSPRRGPVWLLAGALEATSELDWVLIDREGRGASLVALRELELRAVEVAGRLPLHALARIPQQSELALAEERAKEARTRSARLGRIAAAHEMLGAAEGALDLALEHAAVREQFGQPIGRFQAVRHLLAWASADLAAIEGVCRQAVVLGGAAPDRWDAIAKALAGRNGKRVCERALQVLGAVGFTDEHDHHHFHARVLALDVLLGSSSELARSLGARLRTGRVDPRIPRALLAVGGAP